MIGLGALAAAGVSEGLAMESAHAGPAETHVEQVEKVAESRSKSFVESILKAAEGKSGAELEDIVTEKVEEYLYGEQATPDAIAPEVCAKKMTELLGEALMRGVSQDLYSALENHANAWANMPRVERDAASPPPPPKEWKI